MDVLPYMSAGALTVLVVVISYLLRWITVDRQDCRRMVADMEKRIADMEKRHAVEISSLAGRLEEAAMERRQIQTRVDDERERRRHAEDIAYQLARARGQPTATDASD